MFPASKISFEFFPPKDAEGEERLWQTLERLNNYNPDFVSVTYGAGGSTKERSIRISKEIISRTNLSTVAHFTCVGATKQELVSVLDSFKEAGIKKILALRGDPQGGPLMPWTSTPGGISHADGLVALIEMYGGFEIGVAAFPDGHPNSHGDFDQDIKTLLRKEALGATFAISQFFFEVSTWQKTVDRLDYFGSSLPIYPGILPITNLKQLQKMAEMGGAEIPDNIYQRLSAVSEEDVPKVGIEIASELCEKLIAEGAPGLHFYTMNSYHATEAVFNNLISG